MKTILVITQWILCLSPLTTSAQSVFDSLYATHQAEVYFAFGKYDLDSYAENRLDSIARLWPVQKPGTKLRITAHTDSIGSLERNFALSKQRAETVQNALVKRGLPAEAIQLTYFGERKPATGNATEEGRQRNRRATLDFYHAVPMVPFSGQVKDQRTGAGIPATVQISSRSRRDSVQTDTTGFYFVHLPRDSVVKIEIFAEGHFFESAMKRINRQPELVPFEMTLIPASPGEKVAIKNMFFIGNQAVLLESSEPELPKVLKFMQLNPTIEIEIAGHINHPGVAPDDLEAWEWELSVNRAKLVYDYLVENGIAATRMIYKGYGNTEMLFPNRGATEEQQEKNRRVEIRVVK